MGTGGRGQYHQGLVLVFIHIGKTGGTFLKSRLRQASKAGPTKIRTTRGHAVTLPGAVEEFPDSGVLFAIREPSALFVSAFNSRQRKGQPRLYHEHSKGEARAFARFQSPDELAVALGSIRPSVRREAHRAMSSIYHLRRAYSYYLKDLATLEQYSERIVFIFQTETLNSDLEEFGQRIGSPIRVSEGTDLERHAAPGEQSTDLSRRGRLALERHWRSEFEIYRWTVGYRERILSEPPRLLGVTSVPDSPPSEQASDPNAT